eukprot:11821773-Alexandrium_andersonii.AAC.1
MVGPRPTKPPRGRMVLQPHPSRRNRNRRRGDQDGQELPEAQGEAGGAPVHQLGPSPLSGR